MKKVLVMHLGARITFGSVDRNGNIKPSIDRSSGGNECIILCNMLKECGFDVSIATKICQKDYLPEEYTFLDVMKMYKDGKFIYDIKKEDYDFILCVNGMPDNIFGGVEDGAIYNMALYALMHFYNGPLYYMFVDTGCYFRQLKELLEAKTTYKWLDKYDLSDLYINPENVTYLSQPRNIEEVKELINKPKSIICNKFKTFQFEQFPCIINWGNYTFNENPTYDLIYGGCMRGNKRVEKMVRYYYGYSNDIRSMMFGNLDQKVLDKEAIKYGVRKPEFEGKINYSEVFNKLHDSLATVIIVDKNAENLDHIGARVYESICTNVVTFIDIDADKSKRIFGNNKLLSSFNYVRTKKEVEEKLLKLKSDREFRKDIIEEQLKHVNFNMSEYIESLKKCF
ncbi:MAG: hypothetical protein RSE41_06860 [Clostridia bacterium]